VSADVEWDPSAALIQEAYTAATLIATLVERELHARGVPSQLFSLLGWIRVLQPVSPGDLGFSTGIPPTTLRDHLRRLVARGDIRRTPNPSDGRSYLIVVTAAGMRTVDRGRPAIADAFRKLEPHLPRAAAEYARYAAELREALQRATLTPARGAAATQTRSS
jgi:DNA-binding MarR family transcriptional regulator